MYDRAKVCINDPAIKQSKQSYVVCYSSIRSLQAQREEKNWRKKAFPFSFPTVRETEECWWTQRGYHGINAGNTIKENSQDFFNSVALFVPSAGAYPAFPELGAIKGGC